MSPLQSPDDPHPPLAAPPDVVLAIEAAVEALWPREEVVAPETLSGWPKASRRTWRFASRQGVSPVQLRREQSG